MNALPWFRIPVLLLLAALAWSALAVHPSGSEASKAAGLILVAALLCWRGLPAAPPLRPLLAAGLVAVLVAALALDPAGALAGSQARAAGLASLLAALLLAAHAASLDGAARATVYRGIGVLAGLVAGYALLQAFGLDPVAWQGAAGRRPHATLGNATVLAGWLLLTLPATMLAARLAPSPWPWWASALLQALALLASGTRSAWLALAALALLACGWRLGWRRTLPWLLLAMAITAALFAWRPASLQDRVHLWTVATQAWAAPRTLPDLDGREDPRRDWRRWIGYGPDQQRQALDPSLVERPPARDGAAGWEADRAHQLLLDTLLQGGLLGLAALAWLVLGLGRCLLQAHRQDAPAARAEARALAAALAGWLVHLQFAFPLNADLALAAVLAGCALATAGPVLLRWRPASALAGLCLLLPVLALVSTVGAAWLAPAREAERAFIAGQAGYASALAAAAFDTAQMRAAALEFERAAQLQQRDRDAALAAASAWVELAAGSGELDALERARRWMAAVSRMTPGDSRLAPLRARIEGVAAGLRAGG